MNIIFNLKKNDSTLFGYYFTGNILVYVRYTPTYSNAHSDGITCTSQAHATTTCVTHQQVRTSTPNNINHNTTRVTRHDNEWPTSVTSSSCDVHQRTASHPCRPCRRRRDSPGWWSDTARDRAAPAVSLQTHDDVTTSTPSSFSERDWNQHR